MSFFIQKIFEDNVDDTVHLQFQKFSKGTFENKALLKVKHSKGKYTIGTTSEYANELVRSVAKKLGSNEGEIKGVVVSTQDLTGQLDFVDKKQFMGVKQYKIDVMATGDELIALCNKFPRCFMGLSFQTDDTTLKIKAKAPKSSKPSSKGDKPPEPDFCKIKTTDLDLVRGLLFDVALDSFKEVRVDHAFVIEDLEIDYSISDPNEMREKAKRKGRIVRKITIDGNENTTEKAFVA